MLYVKAFHVIAMVAWFAGLFYLPRLYVYHADAIDMTSVERFKIMEKRLYYGITWPAAVMTTILGGILFIYNLEYYSTAAWMHWKIGGVLLLWVYHLGCGHFLKVFKHDHNNHGATFYRVYNEMPTILLIAIVLLVIVKPS